MKDKLGRRDSGFKIRVALEVIKGVRTIQEIAKEFEVRPVQGSEVKCLYFPRPPWLGQQVFQGSPSKGKFPAVAVIALLCLLFGHPPVYGDTPTPRNSTQTVLLATAFGLVGDGESDDGPAIARLLEAAREAEGPVALRFPRNKTIRVTTSPRRYVLPLTKVHDLTIDGGGSIFVLSPDLRLIHLTHSRNVHVRNLRIDYDPLPFVEGVIEAIEDGGRLLRVSVAEPMKALPEGGPTRVDGEQAFFSLVWRKGPHGLVSEHFWTRRITARTGNVLEVTSDTPSQVIARLAPGEARISIPVPGAAHRLGPGACVEIRENHNVAFDNVEMWSAPWFGFRVFGNAGEVSFRNTHIRPRPGTTRLLSVWRDGFHVKNNAARLLWDKCHLEGMGDDAFNLATHSSSVVRLESPTRIVARQRYPLEHVTFQPGHELRAVDDATGRIVGRARVVKVQTRADSRSRHRNALPLSVLTLDQPIDGLAGGHRLWQPDFANPGATIRHCTIRMSCRFQTPVVLESCDVTALLWFYAVTIEGPGPERVVIRDSTLRRGRGNPIRCVIVSGQGRHDGPSPAPRLIAQVLLERNVFFGECVIRGAGDVTLSDNHFSERRFPRPTLRNNQQVR